MTTNQASSQAMERAQATKNYLDNYYDNVLKDLQERKQRSALSRYYFCYFTLRIIYF